MAITTQRQMDEGKDLTPSGDRTKIFVYKGDYAALEATHDALKNGDEHEGMIVLSSNLRRNPGGLGTLSITCAPNDTIINIETQEREQTPLKVVWQLRSVRNDVSVLGYCNSVTTSGASREDVEAWMKEPDGELAKANSYRKADGTVVEISHSDTLKIINKLREGKEAVMRFYPLVIKTSIYSTDPGMLFEGLGKIGIPERHPAGFSWLKCQDDLTEDTGGQWQHVEAWMGTPENPGWDPDFYGPNAWPMPLI